MGAFIVVLLVIFGLVIILAVSGLTVVQQAQAVVVERLGKFDRLLDSGLHYIWPFIEKARLFRLEGRYNRRIDLREQVMDFPPQPVITNDNVTMQVDSVIYYQIADPIRASYEIEDVSLAIRQLAITSMRNVMGELELDQALTSRETVNSKLRATLDEATDKWGIKVNRVELKNIHPPSEIEEAMSRQMKAERFRRATVTEAEGKRKSQILLAEGERDAAIAAAEGRRRAQILDAEGEAQAIREVAAAKADAIRATFKGIHDGKADKGVVAIKYLETLEKVANTPSAKLFIPYEATGVLGSLTAMAEIAKEKVDGETTKKLEG